MHSFFLLQSISHYQTSDKPIPTIAHAPQTTPHIKTGPFPWTNLIQGFPIRGGAAQNWLGVTKPS